MARRPDSGVYTAVDHCAAPDVGALAGAHPPVWTAGIASTWEERCVRKDRTLLNGRRTGPSGKMGGMIGGKTREG